MNIFLFKNRIGILLLVLSLFAASCQKKWKKPTDVSVNFLLNSNSSDGFVKFTSGYFLLARIDFDGVRKQGDNNVAFSKDYDPNTQILLSASTSLSSVAFDIPQGTYTDIDLEVRTEEQANDDPTIIVYGTYVNSAFDTLAVRFEFTSGETFEVQGQNSSGGTEVLLIEDQPATTAIIFNPKYWFDVVPQSMLESATIVIENSVQTIIISESENEDIYQLVVARLNDGNQAIFN